MFDVWCSMKGACFTCDKQGYLAVHKRMSRQFKGAYCTFCKRLTASHSGVLSGALLTIGTLLSVSARVFSSPGMYFSL